MANFLISKQIQQALRRVERWLIDSIIDSVQMAKMNMNIIPRRSKWPSLAASAPHIIHLFDESWNRLGKTKPFSINLTIQNARS